MKYILEGRTPKVCEDPLTWGQWFATADRQVALDEIDGATISTVFVGLDHSFHQETPKLFETMVFGGPLDGTQRRSSTWEEAEAIHRAMCQQVKALEQGKGLHAGSSAE